MKRTGRTAAKPTIGITMGDPAGVGPEIIVRALASRKVRSLCRAVVIGRPEVLDGASRSLGLPLRFAAVPEPSRKTASRTSPLIEAGGRLTDLRLGRPRAAGGRAAVAAIEKAAALALAGDLDGIVTAPISKEGIRRAGSLFPGHTEMLAALTGTDDFAMMLVGGGIRVSLATIHIPLREVFHTLDTAGIRRVIELTWRALGDFGAADAGIAVCGLNPHAGEAGIMGEEDRRLIAPAVRAAARKGIPVSGPWPADTIFYRAARGEFGAVVAMYHDQGLIPVKTLAFDTGVNLTLGLPIIRTSVDHGTAYDIAGKGIASSASLVSAIEIAAAMARQRAERA
jgi:4-hydroxythreonine-4-phosphate dehydrogenase